QILEGAAAGDLIEDVPGHRGHRAEVERGERGAREVAAVGAADRLVLDEDLGVVGRRVLHVPLEGLRAVRGTHKAALQEEVVEIGRPRNEVDRDAGGDVLANADAREQGVGLGHDACLSREGPSARRDRRVGPLAPTRASAGGEFV
ncbi:MAG: hypothetical protein EBY66_06010, partial [Candidatus Fonsibacter lacus]|nr:hypothetical protein [Pseudomonadota bacterium]NCU72548.1 hypothetical protein [Candidatus Fonsibacter lacus]